MLEELGTLAYLDRDRVMRAAKERHLIKGRPAFHYRLPNCLVDEPDWTVAREWNTWVAVERLAGSVLLLVSPLKHWWARPGLGWIVPFVLWSLLIALGAWLSRPRGRDGGRDDL